MPFDYDSFLQGVQTGLRLGRTTKSRQPPVPSGRYILAEDGTPIVLEQEGIEGITIYRSNVWYPHKNGWKQRYAYDGNCFYFFAKFTDLSRQDGVVFYTIDDPSQKSGWGGIGQQMTPEGWIYNQVDFSAYSPIVDPSHNPPFFGDVRYAPTNIQTAGFTAFPGADKYEGRFYSTDWGYTGLWGFMHNLTILPMITEGG